MTEAENYASEEPSEEMKKCYPQDMLDCWDPAFLRYRGMEHGRGWIGLVTGLHFRLRYLVGDYRIHQVKQKFGGLRYYCDAVSIIPDGLPDTGRLRETVRNLISDAEHRSETICERCGHAGTVTIREGWARSRCGPCKDREDAEREEEKSNRSSA